MTSKWGLILMQKSETKTNIILMKSYGTDLMGILTTYTLTNCKKLVLQVMT